MACQVAARLFALFLMQLQEQDLARVLQESVFATIRTAVIIIEQSNSVPGETSRSAVLPEGGRICCVDSDRTSQ